MTPPPNETPRRAPNAIIAPPAPATSPKRPELARTLLLCFNVSTQKHLQYTNLVASYINFCFYMELPCITKNKSKHWGENLCKINMNGKWGDGYPFCNYLLVTGDTQRGNVVSAKKQEIAQHKTFLEIAKPSGMNGLDSHEMQTVQV